jgi:hypothetical protein
MNYHPEFFSYLNTTHFISHPHRPIVLPGHSAPEWECFQMLYRLALIARRTVATIVIASWKYYDRKGSEAGAPGCEDFVASKTGSARTQLASIREHI